MIVVKLQGGLGNQMFQYACGRALADRTGRSLYLDLTTLQDTTYRQNFSYRKFELDLFSIRAVLADQKTLRSVNAYPSSRLEMYKLRLFKSVGLLQHFHEKKFGYDNAIEKFSGAPLFLTGFWQSEKYFFDDQKAIREDLNPIMPKDETNLMYLEQIMSCTAVSVHIRRGDYLNNSTHPLCPLNYYEMAIDMVNQKIKNPVYFIFSDDPQWVKANFEVSAQISFVDTNASQNHYDQLLMSRCQHHIIANSSFSWWAAWLNPRTDKMVIAPKKWFSNNQISTADLIPANWTTI